MNSRVSRNIRKEASKRVSNESSMNSNPAYWHKGTYRRIVRDLKKEHYEEK